MKQRRGRGGGRRPPARFGGWLSSNPPDSTRMTAGRTRSTSANGRPTSRGDRVSPKMRYASSFISASRPSRRNAITPLRMPATMWRKKRSSGPEPAAGRSSPAIFDRGAVDARAGRRAGCEESGMLLSVTACTRPVGLRANRVPDVPDLARRKTRLKSGGYRNEAWGHYNKIVMNLRFRHASVAVGDGLQLFPLVHQVADLPHEGLMAIDDGLHGGAILVKPGR